jgi:hypothetical protein
LCGALNSNLFRLAAQFDPATTLFITAGKRASQFIAVTHRQLAAEFTFSDAPRFDEARPIAAFARDLFLKREVDDVQIVATRFINTLTQQADAVEFLPIGEIPALRIPAWSLSWPRHHPVLFEVNAGGARVSFGHYLNIYIYRSCSRPRPAAKRPPGGVKNATDNAAGLIKDLTSTQQSAPGQYRFKELLEIAAANWERRNTNKPGGTMNKAKFVQVVGPVVDVEFADTLPGIYHADRRIQGPGPPITRGEAAPRRPVAPFCRHGGLGAATRSSTPAPPFPCRSGRW